MQKHHQRKPASSQACVHNGKLIIITGPRGSGKTRACQQLAKRLNGDSLCGLISVPVISNGEKIAIDLLDLETGQCRLLATRPGKPIKFSTNQKTRGWNFLPGAMSWANQKFRAFSDYELLIVDELGPLEFKQHKGFVAAFPLIVDRSYHCAFVVVRPSLIEHALSLWPWGQVVEISSSPDLMALAQEDSHD